ncbi:MAG: phage antirepressor N-terminal domain-containing protein [Muribaculaceae bacterium]|nr:phage antirepressor N-terminal domain-containing protein [Muribaculaceae bacterium]
MESQTISRINGVEIPSVVESGETYLPIKPICQAIGIEAAPQREKIQNDEFFNSVGTIIVSTGADGKSYEMFCLPLKFIYGWLATINPGKVAPEARDKVVRYRMECYEVLYDHFAGLGRKAQEENQAEIKLLEEIANLSEQSSQIKSEIKEKKEVLSKLRASRLDPQPTLF